MDKTDIQIISLLQKNARISVKDIASKVFLSSPAVASRIARLEEQGIIKGYVTKLDMSKIGYHVAAYISLDLKQEQRSEFLVFIKEQRNIVECSFVTGEYSVLMKVAFHSTQQLGEFVDELCTFGKTLTNIVFSSVISDRNIEIRSEIHDKHKP